MNTERPELNKKVDPIKELLIRMERIVGNECYNQNIQNYGPGGVREGDGRSYRYPITFTIGDKDYKHKYGKVSSDVDAEVLMTGRYKFEARKPTWWIASAKSIPPR